MVGRQTRQSGQSIEADFFLEMPFNIVRGLGAVRAGDNPPRLGVGIVSTDKFSSVLNRGREWIMAYSELRSSLDVRRGGVINMFHALSESTRIHCAGESCSSPRRKRERS